MAAGRFLDCLAVTLVYEGGYSDNKKDPGGATNMGITMATLRAWLDKPVTKAQVKALTRKDVEPIYRKGYWDAAKCEALAPGVDLAVFDYGVNSGVSRARAALLACLGGDGKATIQKLCAKRLGFVHGLSTFKTFGKGWSARIAAIEAKGVAMWFKAAGVASPAKALHEEADKAASKAGQQGTTAGGAVATGGASGAATAGGIAANSSSVTLWLIAGVVLLVLVVGAVFAFKASQNSARAKAYADAARSVA